jgi:hypothetical protein
MCLQWTSHRSFPNLHTKLRWVPDSTRGHHHSHYRALHRWACTLPISGERWFKKGKLPAEVCNKFLVAEHQNPDWSQGIPILWLKEEWRGIMSTIQRYITGEGRFSIVHCYHIRFLMHLNGDKELNLPFYLLKILTKMSKRIHNYPESSHRSLYHQGSLKYWFSLL